MSKRGVTGIALGLLIGFISMIANAGAPPEPSGKWILDTINGEAVLERDKTAIEFSEEGRVGMRAGCNNIMSSYELTPGGMKFGLGATTMMACPDPLMQQEQDFLKALESIRDFRVEGDSIYFLDDANTVVISATRS